MESAILIMLWLLTCTLCAVGGYFYAVKSNKHSESAPITVTFSDDEIKKQEKAAAELSNFYKYDGTEQG